MNLDIFRTARSSSGPPPGSPPSRNRRGLRSLAVALGLALILGLTGAGTVGAASLPAPTLKHAVVGAPTPSGFTVSTKTTGAVSVRLKVASDPALTVGTVLGAPAAPFRQSASHKGGPWSNGRWPTSAGLIVRQYGFVTVTDAGSHIAVAINGYDSSNVARVNLTVNVTP